jgi:hypothetical protein
MVNWPDIVRDFWEAYGQDAPSLRPATPSAKAIDDLDAVLILVTKALDVNERKLVWDRAFRRPWKVICTHFHCDKTTAWRNYSMALMKLVACERGLLDKIKKDAVYADELTPKIYAVQAETSKAIKIGFSYNPKERMANLQVAVPEKLVLLGSCDGAMTHEKAIHAHLSPHQLQGEWFKPDALVMEAVNKIIKCETAREVLQHLEACRRRPIAA